MRTRMAALVSFVLILQACSSRPRDFRPQLGITPTDQSKFDAAYSECRQLFVTGKLDTNGKLASGGAGAAAGGAVGLGGGALATGAGLYGGMAVMSATLVLMPVAIIGGAVGMAKVKRHKKEMAIQHAMNGCLRERGYEVVSWQKAPKAKPPLPSIQMPASGQGDAR